MLSPPDIGDATTAVLVEGVSDQRAVTALAERSGRDLPGEGVVILAMGGATNIGGYLAALGPHGRNLRLAGLCDEGEVRFFQAALHKNGLTSTGTPEDLAAQHFRICRSDLEDELIRALGVQAVERILDRQADLRSFRTFQQQPDQQGKSDLARLRRFMGTRGGRKIHYASLLVESLDDAQIPAPLARLLADL